MMTLEYLNERSHYRQTGIKTVRYGMDRKYIDRDERIHGPSLDENGRYRPRKPKVCICIHIHTYTLSSEKKSFELNYLFRLYSEVINHFVILFSISGLG